MRWRWAGATGVLDFRKMVAAGATVVQPSGQDRRQSQRRSTKAGKPASPCRMRFFFAGYLCDLRARRQARHRSSACSPTSDSPPMQTVPVVGSAIDARRRARRRSEHELIGASGLSLS
jgi:hypothetical protein